LALANQTDNLGFLYTILKFKKRFFQKLAALYEKSIEVIAG